MVDLRRTTAWPDEGEVSRPISDATQKDQKGEDSDPAPGGFLFITSTGQTKLQDRKQLKSLRAHVMHNYLGRSHAMQLQSAETNATGAPVEKSKTLSGRSKSGVAGGQKMRFRLRTDGLEQRYPYRYRKGKKKDQRKTETEVDEAKGQSIPPTTLQLPDSQPSEGGFVPGLPLTWLGSRRIDAFNVLPVRIGSKDHQTLDLFHQVQRYPWCPINGHSSWSTFAMSDQLVFHATMFSWGMHFQHRRPYPDPEEEMQVIQHKVAAIRLINDRLSNTSEAVSDETVAAVAALTNIALVVDSFQEANKHMAGLQAIVEMRGGLSSLASGVQQHLQRLISWNDLIYSEVFDEQLRFPPIDVWDESWGSFHRPNIHGPLPGLSRAELSAARVPRHQVLELLSDIRELCHVERVSPLSGTNEPGRMRRGDMFHRIERQLRLITQGDTSPENSRLDATVWRAVSLAALIFTHHHLRGNPLKYRHFSVLSTQLYDTLLSMDEELAELDFAPKMLVWILGVGAVVSPSVRVVHSAFVSMLEKACRRYGLREWDAFRDTLSDFLWTGEADEKRYSELWEEVEPLL